MISGLTTTILSTCDFDYLHHQNRLQITICPNDNVKLKSHKGLGLTK